MKSLIGLGMVGILAASLLTGCVAAGGKNTTEIYNPTLGQQLIDLQKAKDAGAISDAEYQAQKAKFLNGR